MNSSIFSSNAAPGTPVRILGVCLLLLVGYAFMSRNILYRSFTAPSQFQENKHKGEQFVYRVNKIQTTEYSAIVGSSLSALLKEEYFSTPTINIAFSGGSPLTGLEYIIQSGAQFKKIYVDATVLRPLDRQLLDLIENKFDRWRIQNLAVTNVDHQPVVVLTNFLKEKFGVISVRQFDPKQFQQGIESQKESDAAFLLAQKSQYLEQVRLLKEKISVIKSRKTDVVMLEMPLDSRVGSLPMYRFQREALRNEFKSELWIGGDRPELQTLDGLHLSVDSAMLFAHEIEGLK